MRKMTNFSIDDSHSYHVDRIESRPKESKSDGVGSVSDEGCERTAEGCLILGR
jgi:hypothetical protein